jgi:pilus assembly protein CpaE
VPVFFNSKPRNTILDLATRSDELDVELVEEVLTQHESGIKLLAPPRPEEAEHITGQQFANILRFMGENYPLTIVDTSHRLSDVTLAAFDTSSLVLLLTSQDIPSLSRARKFLELAPLINLDRKRILSVMNPYDKRIGITPEKVGQTFQVEIGAVIPLESETVLPSINRGVPFTLQKELQNRAVARAIQTLADTVRQRIEMPVEETPH